MTDLLKDNINSFKTIEDCDYLFRKDHQRRGDISIELIREVIDEKSKQPQKLLSVACAVGIIEEKIKDCLGLTVYGIDASKETLKKAGERGLITTEADISKSLPFANDYFDFVFAGEIIEHLLDTRNFLKEIGRILKPQGYLILTTPNLARIDDRLKFLWGKAPRQTSPLHPYLYLHIRPFTFDSLKKSLKQCGFGKVILRTEVFRLAFWGREVFFYSKLLAKILPTWGATLIIRAQKNS